MEKTCDMVGDEDIRILINENIIIRNKLDDLELKVRSFQLDSLILHKAKHYADIIIYLYGFAIVLLGIAHLFHVIGAH